MASILTSIVELAEEEGFEPAAKKLKNLAFHNMGKEETHAATKLAWLFQRELAETNPRLSYECSYIVWNHSKSEEMRKDSLAILKTIADSNKKVDQELTKDILVSILHRAGDKEFNESCISMLDKIASSLRKNDPKSAQDISELICKESDDQKYIDKALKRFSSIAASANEAYPFFENMHNIIKYDPENSEKTLEKAMAIVKKRKPETYASCRNHTGYLCGLILYYSQDEKKIDYAKEHLKQQAHKEQGPSGWEGFCKDVIGISSYTMNCSSTRQGIEAAADIIKELHHYHTEHTITSLRDSLFIKGVHNSVYRDPKTLNEKWLNDTERFYIANNEAIEILKTIVESNMEKAPNMSARASKWGLIVSEKKEDFNYFADAMRKISKTLPDMAEGFLKSALADSKPVDEDKAQQNPLGAIHFKYYINSRNHHEIGNLLEEVKEVLLGENPLLRINVLVEAANAVRGTGATIGTTKKGTSPDRSGS